MVDRFLGPLKLPHLLDLARPVTIGGLSDPECYTAFRRKIQLAHDQALEAWADVGRQWGELTGRSYDVIEEYRLARCGTGAGGQQHAGDDGPGCDRCAPRTRHCGRLAQAARLPAFPGECAETRVGRKAGGGGAGPQLLVRTSRNFLSGDQVRALRAARRRSVRR